MSSKTQFDTELKQLQSKFLSLYSEAQQLFHRHADVAPQAGTKVMPHLEEAKKKIESLVKPVEKPARLMDAGD